MLVQELIRELQKFDQNAELNYVDWNNKNMPITAIRIYEQNDKVCYFKVVTFKK